MTIEITYDRDQNLATLVVSDLISVDEMRTALEDFYAQGPSKLALWDMSQSDFSMLSPDELWVFVRRAAELGKEREGGLTAIVAPAGFHSAFTRLAETFTKALPFRLSIFRSREDALTWLNSEQAG